MSTGELQGEIHKCFTAGAGIHNLLNPFHNSGSRSDPKYLNKHIERSNSERRFIETRKKERINSIKFAQEKTVPSWKNNYNAKGDNNDADIITVPAGHIPFEFEKNTSFDSKNNEDSSISGFYHTDLKPSYLIGAIDRHEEEMRCPLTAKSYFLNMMETMSHSSSIGVCV